MMSKSYIYETALAFGFPIVMFIMAIVPGLNFIFSGHGGISWLIIPLCFPSVVFRAALKCKFSSEEQTAQYRRYYKAAIPTYIGIAVPLSWAAVTSIENTFGLTVSAWAFFGIMVSPVPWSYFM